MGLDAVELVLEIEEKFGVTLADDEVIYWNTLGHYHDYLLQHCTGWRRPDCPTQKAFYRLRRAMRCFARQSAIPSAINAAFASARSLAPVSPMEAPELRIRLGIAGA